MKPNRQSRDRCISFHQGSFSLPATVDDLSKFDLRAWFQGHETNQQWQHEATIYGRYAEDVQAKPQ